MHYAFQPNANQLRNIIGTAWVMHLGICCEMKPTVTSHGHSGEWQVTHSVTLIVKHVFAVCSHMKPGPLPNALCSACRGSICEPKIGASHSTISELGLASIRLGKASWNAAAKTRHQMSIIEDILKKSQVMPSKSTTSTNVQSRVAVKNQAPAAKHLASIRTKHFMDFSHEECAEIVKHQQKSLN